MKSLIICRGKSGAGKTTFAKTIEQICNVTDDKCKIVCADDYFIKNNQYQFDPTKLGKAHQLCFEKVTQAMFNNFPIIIVHNTFTTEKEINPYLKLASNNNYQVFSIIIENRHGNINVHNVPEEKLNIQKTNILKSIKL